MMASIRHDVASVDGFTLVELLVTMMIGLLVTGAAFTILTVSTNTSKAVVDRVDATQRGRIGMEQIVQQLRSISCPPDASTNSIIAAGPTSITFSSDLDGDDDFNPIQRRLRTEPRGSMLDIVGDRNPNNPRVLVDQMELVDPARPVFSYWVPNAAGTNLQALSLTADVSAADRPRIARIDVAFATKPTASTPRETTNGVPIESSVYPRQGRGGQASTVPTFGC